ncbi:methyltransferase family protein [Tropicimonas isoalkanivorans]|uniref:Protein-S-isoprenylcysteine O-methyltransferase Ste14 n=1 Tax=Tropicimonas isoalkanivorans TaxID=441112 RepID=A0A1I1GAQ8_9RHOB|nr:isoprenylcysteine carboxylmethyltransferase family protein [Tropicimonas isoalkanivorans]SFC08496.1 Protein-S-isoprenylcysteine O-methyltransferase Ste14 [Tropicimonas isoalkanivorans]
MENGDGDGKIALRHWVDLPPVWLLLFLLLARIQAVRVPVGAIDTPLTDLLAGLLIGGGLLLMAVAVMQMRQNRTTIIPHRHADFLVTNGVFGRSRNPIYLADTLILTGFIVHWSAWPSLILVPLFVWLITDRFILQEEERLRADFGARWEDWAARTRRWL